MNAETNGTFLLAVELGQLWDWLDSVAAGSDDDARTGRSEC